MSAQITTNINNLVGYVYMIQCNEYTKIGYSARPDKRLKEIDLSNPYPVAIVCLHQTKNVYRAEKYLHRLLIAYRIKGEWFLLPENVYFWLKGIVDIDMVINQNLTF